MKHYLVTYKTGRTQMVEGTIVFFSEVDTDVARPPNVVYLNASEVASVIEQPKASKEV